MKKDNQDAERSLGEGGKDGSVSKLPSFSGSDSCLPIKGDPEVYRAEKTWGPGPCPRDPKLQQASVRWRGSGGGGDCTCFENDQRGRGETSSRGKRVRNGKLSLGLDGMGVGKKNREAPTAGRPESHDGEIGRKEGRGM